MHDSDVSWGPTTLHAAVSVLCGCDCPTGGPSKLLAGAPGLPGAVDGAGAAAAASGMEHAVAINNIDVSSEYIQKLRQELDGHAGATHGSDLDGQRLQPCHCSYAAVEPRSVWVALVAVIGPRRRTHLLLLPAPSRRRPHLPAAPHLTACLQSGCLPRSQTRTACAVCWWT